MAKTKNKGAKARHTAALIERLYQDNLTLRKLVRKLQKEMK